MYTVEQRGFLVRKYRQTGSFKASQTAFRTEFGERSAPSMCCIQKLVKKLETRGSRSNACRLLSLGPIERQSVQKYTPRIRTTQRRYTPRDSCRQRRHLGKKYSRIWRNPFKCLNKGWPTRWHLLYYILLNMFQTLIRPSSGASEYLLCCVGWLEACWCYVAGLSVCSLLDQLTVTKFN